MTISSPGQALATLAGTASSQPQALYQQWRQKDFVSMAGIATQAPLLQSAPEREMTVWIATAQQQIPTGLVFWLPTPASAPPEERALEQACRDFLLQDSMQGRTHLHLLYGQPENQLRALSDCLALPTRVVYSPSEASLPAALQHRHTLGMRCRECLDPGSEQRLFSDLLRQQAPP